MTSAPANVSPLASARGLPCSIVISGAIASARCRSRSAALRITFERSNVDTFRHARNPLSAASSARSRSLLSACATVPTGSPVAGLTTGKLRLAAAFVHTPSMNRDTSEYIQGSPRPSGGQPDCAPRLTGVAAMRPDAEALVPGSWCLKDASPIYDKYLTGSQGSLRLPG